MMSSVRKMFDGIACRYDFLNHFLSCFQDIFWRRYCCSFLKSMAKCEWAENSEDGIGKCNIRLLDLCGGTGDFANTFRKIFENKKKKMAVELAVIGDFSFGMLSQIAQKKIDASVVQLDAMQLPFGEKQFDFILNGFGMRNVPDVNIVLEESFRVLAEGGRLCVLEFFSPRNLFNRFFYKVLAPMFIPVMGAFFSGHRDAYEYLVNSIIRFLSVDDFCSMAQSVGFEVEKVKMFDGGVSFGVFLKKPKTCNSEGIN